MAQGKLLKGMCIPTFPPWGRRGISYPQKQRRIDETRKNRNSRSRQAGCPVETLAIQDARNSHAVRQRARTIRTCEHMYGLFGDDGCRVSARAATTAWKPLPTTSYIRVGPVESYEN